MQKGIRFLLKRDRYTSEWKLKHWNERKRKAEAYNWCDDAIDITYAGCLPKESEWEVPPRRICHPLPLYSLLLWLERVCNHDTVSDARAIPMRVRLFTS